MKDLDKFIKVHSSLFKKLAKCLSCPSCNQIVHPPFFNLGPPFFQAEGCKDCYEKVLNKNRK